MRGRLVDFRFNGDPLALKLVTHNKIVFQAGMGSCLLRLKCKWNARCVAVTDWFVLINVSTMKVRCSPVQFMSATEKETKNSGIINKRNKMALYVLFEKENTFSFLGFIWLLLNLQMCQIILLDPVDGVPYIKQSVVCDFLFVVCS